MSGMLIYAAAKLVAKGKEMSLSCHFGQKPHFMSAGGR
jgi:hypothetical protein